MTIEELEKRLSFLESKLEVLEHENVGTTNALYELENSMQSQIDALINYTMQMKLEINKWGEPNDVY